MNKKVAVTMMALLPALSFGSGAADELGLTQLHTEIKPEISVIALSPEQAKEFAKVRSEYLDRKNALEAEYQAQLDAVLTKPAADKS